MKALYTLALVCAVSFAHAQTPYFAWAKSFGGGSDEYAEAIAVDRTGAVFTAGTFYGTASVDFDPGPGTELLQPPGLYLSKLNAAGDHVWT